MKGVLRTMFTTVKKSTLMRKLSRRSFLAVLVAYLSSKFFMIQAFADDDPTSMFQKHVDVPSDNDVLGNVFAGFIGPLTSLAAVILVIAAIICGMKIGTSAMFGDPRQRQEALVGLVFIIIGAVVVIHAKQIVGMALNVNTNN